MRVISIFATALLLITACKSKDKSNEGNQNGTTTQASPDEDSASIRKVITDFYDWYVGNESRLHTYPLYTSVNKNDAPPYQINWTAVE